MRSTDDALFHRAVIRGLTRMELGHATLQLGTKMPYQPLNPAHTLHPTHSRHSLTCTGHAAASPNAQIVCPSICLDSSHIMSISDGFAWPSTKRHIILLSQLQPSRQGVHCKTSAGDSQKAKSPTDLTATLMLVE
jgi:hypothetical protein